MTQNVEDNLMEVCTPLMNSFQENMEGISTRKAEDTLPERQWTENESGHDCRTSLSSQEECSPACRLNSVQVVLCKLQRPAYSCGLKHGTLSGKDTNYVDKVISKLHKPTRHSFDGSGHQNTVANPTKQDDIEQRSDRNRKSNLESEIKSPSECHIRWAILFRTLAQFWFSLQT